MTICIFGASTTLGFFDIEKGGWVQRLRSFIESSYERHVKVYNLGINGETTDDLVKRFKNECEPRRPNKILFATGTNDSQYILTKDNPRVPIKEFEENLEFLISQAKKFTDDIILIGSTLVDESKTKPIFWNKQRFLDNDDISKYNSVIKSIAEKHNLQFINLEGVLGLDDLYDGLHPNSAGHQKIFEVISANLLIINDK